MLADADITPTQVLAQELTELRYSWGYMRTVTPPGVDVFAKINHSVDGSLGPHMQLWHGGRTKFWCLPPARRNDAQQWMQERASELLLEGTSP